MNNLLINQLNNKLMKRILLLTEIAVLIALTFSSCNKSSNLDLDKTLKFSTLTVEQQKQTIEQNGVDFLNKMEGLQDTKAVAALNEFSSNSGSSMQLAAPLKALNANLKKGNAKLLDNFNTEMIKVVSSSTDIWGVYTWNSSTQQFDFVASSDKTAKFLFPATSTATTNNGELKIVWVDSKVVAPDTDPVQYLPSSVTVTLKVDGNVAMTAEYEGSYKTDGTPTKIKQTLEIEKYNWSAEFTNDEKDASAKYYFKYDSDVLVGIELAAAGSLTADEIQASAGPQDIINSAIVYVRIMNIATIGGFKDFQGFANEMNAINVSDEKSFVDAEVVAMNKYFKCYGYFVDKKQKFADVEFYTSEYQEWDYYSQAYNTYYQMQPRFVLNDGSKQDIEEYFNTGFEDLIAKLQELQGK